MRSQSKSFIVGFNMFLSWNTSVLFVGWSHHHQIHFSWKWTQYWNMFSLMPLATTKLNYNDLSELSHSCTQCHEFFSVPLEELNSRHQNCETIAGTCRILPENWKYPLCHWFTRVNGKCRFPVIQCVTPIYQYSISYHEPLRQMWQTVPKSASSQEFFLQQWGGHGSTLSKTPRPSYNHLLFENLTRSESKSLRVPHWSFVMS